MRVDTPARTVSAKQLPDFRKQSLYFPAEVLRALEHEALRIDRSISWVVQRCIRKGLSAVRELPATAEPDPTHDQASADDRG